MGAEHMLLAMLREPEGVAGRVLTGLGADLSAARGFVAGLVEDSGVPPGISPELAAPRPPRRTGVSRWRRGG
jgi:Clp amino terminal domain, pathogenicity island component